ncbi:transcriptional regulator GutM [Pectinatus haikarae]|uniref:DNA-binding transcriptional regulator of glucitol operon n=1 Tax=Pectinatus haikarae TaxID=349096 RepID=A0ABT9Y7Y8_9FIRM|nr:transcriptional regulator GutM [Pectinatus haikarae]MDQ0203944.1 DNA-binding transcriptional regulator of glucitol operon [Pectinatus haikarae]
MNTMAIIIFGFFAFVLQYILTFLQMNKFTKHYREFRREGRVAIGRYSGVVRAGVIVLFLIDGKGVIKKGKYVQGVTVFAGYKDINKSFTGKYVGGLTQEDCKAAHYSKSLTQAVMDARNNYNIITSGGTLPERKSPFGRLLDMFKFRSVKKDN